MKAIDRRIRRQEREQRGPAQQVMRLVIRAAGRALENLETSQCDRILESNGLLTESVHLDGRDPLNKEDLERFIQQFPIVQQEDKEKLPVPPDIQRRKDGARKRAKE